MKTARLLKMLSLLGFLLLFAPFYDSCNGKKMIDKVAESPVEEMTTTTIKKDSLIVKEIEKFNPIIEKSDESVMEGKTSFYQKIYDFVDDENSESAIEFASFIDDYFGSSFNEFSKSVQKGIHENKYEGFFFGLKNFCFLLIVIITILISMFSFKNIKLVHKLSLLNLTLLLITIICIFLEGFFENISQIKWGYYVFTIVNILIFYFSQKDQNQISNNKL